MAIVKEFKTTDGLTYVRERTEYKGCAGQWSAWVSFEDDKPTAPIMSYEEAQRIVRKIKK